MTEILWLTVLAAGICTGALIRLSPRFFWPAVLLLTIIPCDVVIQSYNLLDQYFVTCILLGLGLYYMWRGRMPVADQPTIKDRYYALHKLLFYSWIFYLLIQSIRGAIVLQSIEKMRWALYFLALTLLSFFSSKEALPVPDTKRFATLLSLSAAAYCLLYIFLAASLEFGLGVSRWVAQSEGWVGGAFSFFPVAIMLPAAVILIQERRRAYCWFGWISLLVIGTAVFIGERRVAWIPLVIVLMVQMIAFALSLRVRRFILLILMVVISGAALTLFTEHKVGDEARRYLDEFVETLSPFGREKIPDLDRLIHIVAAVEAVHESWETTLFGYGFRVSSFKIGPYLESQYQNRLPNLDIRKEIGEIENASTPGISGMLVDTGYLGLGLLFLNLIFVAVRISIRIHSPYRWILLFTASTLPVWLYANNIVTYVLFFFAIMPAGILLQLSSGDVRTKELPAHDVGRL